MGTVLALPLTVLTGIVSAIFPDFSQKLKWIVSYIYVYIYTRNPVKRFDLYDFDAVNDPEKIAFLVPKAERELETPLKESVLQRSADDIFCYGVNGKDECLLVRVSRRCNSESQATVFLKLANGKTYSLPENAPQHQQPSSDSSNMAYTCGGLQVYCLLPMRRWRIAFSGFLREFSDNDKDTGHVVYVKFSFLWRASSDVFDSLTGISKSELATALSSAKWKWPVPPLQRLHEMLDFYCQAGTLYGTVKVGDTPTESEVWLWGERVRFFGDVTNIEGAEFTHVLGHTTNGKIMHIGKISIPNIVENLHFGFLVLYNNSFNNVQKAKIQYTESELHPDEITGVKFIAGEKYKIDVSYESSVPVLLYDKGWYKTLNINHVKISHGQHKGSGLVISGSARNVSPVSTPQPVLYIPKVPPLVVNLGTPLCQTLELSGGKGSSLAKLMALREEYEDSAFTVPKGMVVTTAAYQEFTGDDFEGVVKYIEDVAYGKREENLQIACERVAKLLTEKHLPKTLCYCIEGTLDKMFPEGMNSVSFAVRSSTTGEDSEQLSAAGQMDTYLGVKGLKEILTAVKKCWASQFRFVAIEYKRRNGQPLNTPMAVVIQEMVPCDVAGVLFTCDPISGNPSFISITANYGLGESVVSGSVEPDTVKIRRNHYNELQLESYEVGLKDKKIVMTGDNGTTEEHVDESGRQSQCLTNEIALELAKIALQVEQSYRSHRDIEWGLKNNHIYLLQARPVTSVNRETDFEIIHEFDGPIRCEKEHFTVCNVGEVMPGASSPLGLDIVMKFLGHAFQVRRHRKLHPQKVPPPKYFPFAMLNFCNHCMFSLFMIIIQSIKDRSSRIAQSVMVGMFGRIIDDEKIYDTGKELFSDGKDVPPSRLFMVRYIMNMMRSGYVLRQAINIWKNYNIPTENFRNSQELFDAIMFRCSDFAEPLFAHMMATHGSSMWNMLLLSTLASNKGGFNSEVYRDFAYLLSSCTGVESADVPSAMQSLAFCISQEIDGKKFGTMDTEEAVQWLRNSSGMAGSKFREFLSRHGHRCLKEFDMHSITWGKDPKSLVKLLQALAKTVTMDAVDKKNVNASDVIGGLSNSSSLSLKTRLILRFLLSQSRRGVRERESSKSLSIKCVDVWRRAYNKLAELMVYEGRIPDKDLFFFFNLEEIQEIIKAPSAKLISKANHRRRLFPEMDKYLFPEIMKGVPIPISNDDDQVPIEGDLVMKGVPVSQGVVKSIVRVAMTLEEAAHLKQGEILITYSTDIGWSPYFPVLGGVVTELGGLISHGAVVAREYGIPCVVGLHGATRQFRTGDFALLDGNRGILQRLPNAE